MLVATSPRNRITEILAAKEWSIYKLAEQAGMAYPQLYRLVKAEQIPDGTKYITLKRIAGALGVSIDDLEAKQD